MPGVRAHGARWSRAQAREHGAQSRFDFGHCLTPEEANPFTAMPMLAMEWRVGWMGTGEAVDFYERVSGLKTGTDSGTTGDKRAE